MKQFLANLIKFILSLAIMIFGEQYFYKFLDFIHVDTSNISTSTNCLISIALYLVMAYCIFIIYKDYIKNDLDKFKHKTGKNMLTSLISFLVLFIIIMISNYLCKAIGNSFHLSYSSLEFSNIFNNTMDLGTITYIVTNIILKPIMMVSVFILGVNNLFGDKKGTFFTGVLIGVYTIYLLTNGSFSNIADIFLNIIPPIITYVILSYIYHKNNNSIISMVTFILYMLFSGLILGEVL